MTGHALCLVLLLSPWVTRAGAFEPVVQESQTVDKAFPLAGRWLLTMPRGFEYDATLQPGEEVGLYCLRCGATNLCGIYEVRARRLLLVQPTEPRLAGMAWEIQSANALILVEHPSSANVGADYRGATLGRQKQADPWAARNKRPRSSDVRGRRR